MTAASWAVGWLADYVRTIMGHIWTGTLPATKRRRDVIGLFAEWEELACVAEATADAWQLAVEKARNAAGFREAIWLLAPISLENCASATNFNGFTFPMRPLLAWTDRCKVGECGFA